MSPASSSSPVTVRAVAIGLLSSIVIDLLMAYNDYYLQNTLLIGNHFPIASITVLVLLVLGVNVGARSLFGVNGLNPGELLLIWGMIGVAGGICSAGIMRYFPTWMVCPAYYATSGNEFGSYILRYLPDWAVVSKDPADPAVQWFMEGMPRGMSVPWARWLIPMSAWFGFTLLMYSATFALCAMLYRQWALNERLIFPIVHLPVEISRIPPRGELINSFLANRLTWIGIGIPAVIHAYNGLIMFFPGIPRFPLSWGTWGLFPDRPWSEFNLDTAYLYFSVVGMTFLLTTEMSFSLWFFFVLWKLSFVYVAWLGAGATGFWGNWSNRVTFFQAAGSVLVLSVFLLWTGRRFMGQWLERVFSGKRDPEADPMAPRLAAFLLVSGLAGMVIWFILAGASWWMSVFGIAIFIAVLLVLTRVIAESGLLFVQSNVVPYSILTGLFPPGWLSGITLNVWLLNRAVFHDLREILMPYVMNGMKACEMVGMRVGRVMAVFAVTAVVGLGISAYGRITTHYKYGGVNMDEYANVGLPNWILEEAAKYQKTPPAYDFIKAGERNVLLVSVAHLGIGSLLTAGMLFMRAKFLWWPLHPFGYMMSGSWAISVMWFGIFLGWLAKSCVMTFGGAQVYRRILPLFLGLVLGESMIAALWMIVGAITGQPGQAILPH